MYGDRHIRNSFTLVQDLRIREDTAFGFIIFLEDFWYRQNQRSQRQQGRVGVKLISFDSLGLRKQILTKGI